MRSLILAWLALSTGAWAQNSVKSPDGSIEMTVSTGGGQLRYSVTYRGKAVIDNAALGLQLAGEIVPGPDAHIAAARQGSMDETYSMPHGKSNPVRNYCRTLALDLAGGMPMTLEARAYNDGVAFRYVLRGSGEIRIINEKTEFRIAKDATTYPLILEGFHTPYEDGYSTMPLSGIHASSLVALPLLMELPGVAWAAVTEADIDNYAGMYVQHSGSDARVLTAKLSPAVDDPGLAVRATGPLNSPWRVIMIADQPGRLIESNIDQSEPAIGHRGHIVDQAW